MIYLSRVSEVQRLVSCLTRTHSLEGPSALKEKAPGGLGEQKLRRYRRLLCPVLPAPVLVSLRALARFLPRLHLVRHVITARLDQLVSRARKSYRLHLSLLRHF
jgi:hypothetical protein